MLRKIGFGLGYLLFLGVSVLLLLEISYRGYWFDFYRGNLTGLNPSGILTDPSRESILVVGDSFTADPRGYVEHLRQTFPDQRVINAGVPGTCTRQHQLLFPRRLREFEPRLVIYQLFVGNDLLNWRPPADSPHISTIRRVYWWLSDRLWVLGYLNAKLPQLRQAIYQDLPIDLDPKLERAYAPQLYSERSKMQFRAEAGLVDDSVCLRGRRRQDMENMTKKIRSMLATVPDSCPILVLVMPHCMQLGAPHLERMRAIGASIADPAILTALDYPFLSYLQEELATDQIRILSPLAKLKAAQQAQPVYYENDPHLNPFGQQVVGQMLVPYCSPQTPF